MGDFFEPPPRPPERPRQPPWLGAPPGVLPGVVAIELVLARTEEVAIALSRVSAYPAGFSFDVLSAIAPQSELAERLEPMLHGPGRHRARREPGLSPELLRIGVQFSDGAKATNVSGFPRFPQEGEPAGPVMHERGGGGGGGHWQQGFWVWPLPPPGPLIFVCEWPAAGIPLTRHEIDAQEILDAAGRAQVIFPDDAE